MPGRSSGGLEGVTLSDSAICLVEGETGGLSYRGFDIFELAPSASYESVVHLLLHGDPPARLPAEPETAELHSRRTLSDRSRRLAEVLPRDVAPLDALRTLLSSIDPGAFGYPPTDVQGYALIAQSPTLLTYQERRRMGRPPVEPSEELGHVANYLWMLSGSPPDPKKVRALERYFVLLADHGMNASTLALRTVLSTNSDLLSASVAAIGALKGPAHGGAPSKVTEMLDAVGAPSNAAAWIAAALERKERLFGFGHRVYKTEDPRSKILKSTAREVAEPERFRLAEAVESEGLRQLREARPDQRLYTNVEFYAAVVLEAVGLPKEMFTPTFALARTAGWAAHAIEQSKNNRLIRPDVNYVGPPKGRTWPFPDR